MPCCKSKTQKESNYQKFQPNAAKPSCCKTKSRNVPNYQMFQPNHESSRIEIRQTDQLPALEDIPSPISYSSVDIIEIKKYEDKSKKGVDDVPPCCKNSQADHGTQYEKTGDWITHSPVRPDPDGRYIPSTNNNVNDKRYHVTQNRLSGDPYTFIPPLNNHVGNTRYYPGNTYNNDYSNSHPTSRKYNDLDQWLSSQIPRNIRIPPRTSPRIKPPPPSRNYNTYKSKDSKGTTGHFASPKYSQENGYTYNQSALWDQDFEPREGEDWGSSRGLSNNIVEMDPLYATRGHSIDIGDPRQVIQILPPEGIARNQQGFTENMQPSTQLYSRKQIPYITSTPYSQLAQNNNMRSANITEPRQDIGGRYATYNKPPMYNNFREPNLGARPFTPIYSSSQPLDEIFQSPQATRKRIQNRAQPFSEVGETYARQYPFTHSTFNRKTDMPSVIEGGNCPTKRPQSAGIYAETLPGFIERPSTAGANGNSNFSQATSKQLRTSPRKPCDNTTCGAKNTTRGPEYDAKCSKKFQETSAGAFTEEEVAYNSYDTSLSANQIDGTPTNNATYSEPTSYNSHRERSLSSRALTPMYPIFQPLDEIFQTPQAIEMVVQNRAQPYSEVGEPYASQSPFAHSTYNRKMDMSSVLESAHPLTKRPQSAGIYAGTYPAFIERPSTAGANANANFTKAIPKQLKQCDNYTSGAQNSFRESEYNAKCSANFQPSSAAAVTGEAVDDNSYDSLLPVNQINGTSTKNATCSKPRTYNSFRESNLGARPLTPMYPIIQPFQTPQATRMEIQNQAQPYSIVGEAYANQSPFVYSTCYKNTDMSSVFEKGQLPKKCPRSSKIRARKCPASIERRNTAEANANGNFTKATSDQLRTSSLNKCNNFTNDIKNTIQESKQDAKCSANFQAAVSKETAAVSKKTAAVSKETAAVSKETAADNLYDTLLEIRTPHRTTTSGYAGPLFVCINVSTGDKAADVKSFSFPPGLINCDGHTLKFC